MSSNIDIRHLLYYEKEMNYLRESGGAFAAKYPRIADQLALNNKASPDPHTERLLESFAYLTSYLQKDIDDQFPRFAETFLNVLYPQLLAPLPPMTVAAFTLDPKKGKATTGVPIPKDFPLLTRSATGDVCRFQTCYPTTLWPFSIQNIQIKKVGQLPFTSNFVYPFVLSLIIQTEAMPLSSYDVTSLRFYINENALITNMLYEFLFLDPQPLMILKDQSTVPTFLETNALKQVGFDRDQNVLPDFPQSNSAYRLLQEYFSFPQKFMFFDIDNLSLKGAEKTVEILIPLASQKDTISHDLRVSGESIKLGCTPVINLFPKITEPLRLDGTRIEYSLIPDRRRELTTEIHSIQKVLSARPEDPHVYEIAPYFSYNHQDIQNKGTSYWYAHRVPEKSIPGDKIQISFVDLEFNPELPPTDVVYARTLCTNRDLAMMIHAGSVLQPDQSLPTTGIQVLFQPTPTIYQAPQGQKIWQLVSQLSLNYLSLTNTTQGVQALNELLTLYSASISDQIPIASNTISTIESEPIVRRMGQDAWRGFVKGTGITLTLGGDGFEKYEALLFSSVLSHFFGLYTTINAFTELQIKKESNSEIWKRWPARTGINQLI